MLNVKVVGVLNKEGADEIFTDVAKRVQFALVERVVIDLRCAILALTREDWSWLCRRAIASGLRTAIGFLLDDELTTAEMAAYTLVLARLGFERPWFSSEALARRWCGLPARQAARQDQPQIL